MAPQQQHHEAVAPIDSPLEKVQSQYEKGREEEEVESETASNKESRLARERKQQLSLPLRNTRSRSSARSVKSYKSHTDGYSHFHDAEKQQQDEEADGSPNGEKEFEVKFDGDSDPHNPKNRPYLRKWFIVIIVSMSSLCVTCASALVSAKWSPLLATSWPTFFADMLTIVAVHQHLQATGTRLPCLSRSGDPRPDDFRLWPGPGAHVPLTFIRVLRPKNHLPLRFRRVFCLAHTVCCGE